VAGASYLMAQERRSDAAKEEANLKLLENFKNNLNLNRLRLRENV
jgi:hypothetical protein